MTTEDEMRTTLNSVAQNTGITSNPNFTVMLESQDGKKFVHSCGTSLPTTSYDSASTSKLPVAVMILDLIDKGYLTLNSKPHDLIDFWTGESSVTLRHLLSFTSGFNGEPQIEMYSDYAKCIEAYYNKTIGSQSTPGTQFYYASSHLQIAGLMAIKATGKSWAQIFTDFKTQTGLFPNSQFNIPRSDNPRLAGGMHWTANDYMMFLRALVQNKRPLNNLPLLSQDNRTELFNIQTPPPNIIIKSSPIWNRMREDWRYGFGNWLECPTAKTVNSYNCGVGYRNSCPGAYGAYPFIDFDHAYFGIVARKGSVGTFHEGINIFRSIQSCANTWSGPTTCPIPTATLIDSSPSAPIELKAIVNPGIDQTVAETKWMINGTIIPASPVQDQVTIDTSSLVQGEYKVSFIVRNTCGAWSDEKYITYIIINRIKEI